MGDHVSFLMRLSTCVCAGDAGQDSLSTFVLSTLFFALLLALFVYWLQYR